MNLVRSFGWRNITIAEDPNAKYSSWSLDWINEHEVIVFASHFRVSFIDIMLCSGNVTKHIISEILNEFATSDHRYVLHRIWTFHMGHYIFDSK
jgi:hypothetical protein